MSERHSLALRMMRIDLETREQEASRLAARAIKAIGEMGAFARGESTGYDTSYNVGRTVLLLAAECSKVAALRMTLEMLGDD